MTDQSHFISPSYTYAVVGASRDESKYGFKVYQDLLNNDFQVYPINPKGGKLLGNKVYQSLRDLPIEIDVVVMVVPPKIGQGVLAEVRRLGINRVWFQPGSESQTLLKYCQKHSIQTQAKACIMTARSQ